MDSLTVMKKVRKLSRKGKLLSGNSGLDEKKEMLTALMNKTGKSYKVRVAAVSLLPLHSP